MGKQLGSDFILLFEILLMSGISALELKKQSIEQIFDLKAIGKLVINDSYQRSFVWKEPQKQALIESISESYPIGVLVLWNHDGNPSSTGSKPKLGYCLINTFVRFNIFIICNFLSCLLKLSERCPICRQKFTEHSELQDKICKIITIKEFAAYCPGFDVQFRPSFDLD